MILNIRDITNIYSGVNLNPALNGQIVYLQVRHFTSDGYYNYTGSGNILLDAKIHTHLLMDGDILFASRGDKNPAFIYNKAIIGPAVAASSFLVFRIKHSHLITPGYLSWFLNSDKIQSYFRTIARGSSIKSITKGMLEELKVPIPSLPQQTAIFMLSQQQKIINRIQAELSKKQNTELEQKIFNTINKQL